MHFEKKCTGHSQSSWDLLTWLFLLRSMGHQQDNFWKNVSYSELQLHNEQQSSGVHSDLLSKYHINCAE